MFPSLSTVGITEVPRPCVESSMWCMFYTLITCDCCVESTGLDDACVTKNSPTASESVNCHEPREESGREGTP